MPPCVRVRTHEAPTRSSNPTARAFCRQRRAETYSTLAKDVTKIFRERMVAGFLLATDPDHAKELIDRYDKDGT